jgi:hypothetical protein
MIGAVGKFDGGVHDALRVHRDADALGRHVKEPARLDHFEALVHERRGIDADLAAHVPLGMRDGLLGRDVRKVPAAAERPARSGEQDRGAAALLFGSALQALENRAVLAVDGQERRARLAHGAHQEPAAADDAFLVGKKEPLARAGRGKGERHARGADHRLHDGVRLRVARELGNRLRAARDVNARETLRLKRRGEFAGLRGVGDRRARRTEAPARLGELLDARASGERMHAKALRMARDDVERAAPDAARGAEKSYLLHLLLMPLNTVCRAPPRLGAAEPLF